LLATASVVIWLFFGITYHFLDTWQLVINTITNIFEFLILFLIQNTQNREALNINIKLDELLRSNKESRNSIIALDKLSDEELKKLENEYKKISNKKS
jgi:low affinity Fe/Cu permease